MIKALVEQGEGIRRYDRLRKSRRSLTSPWGRVIDAYVFGRSYQEVDKGEFGSVEEALDGSDAMWRTRELIIMPSHVATEDHSDIDEMIDLAHSAGFDAIAASVILSWDGGDNRDDFPNIWRKGWDERWTIPNQWKDDPENPEGQLEALGRDLWVLVCRALAG
ncbi:MAG: hypothetical protein CMP81_08090 [Fulvimarina sp.]|nr:hypothetical protein [Fulvimarina sp.]